MAGLLLLLLHPLLLLSHAPHCSPHQISERSFRRLVAAAQRCQRPLRLKGRTVELLEGLSLSSSLPLTIAGPGTIASEGHAVFTVGGNRQRLELTGPALRIVHRASAARTSRRETGAALFCRGKARVRVSGGCTVSSEAGYGIWMVQAPAVSVVGAGTAVADCGRSGVACFGSGRLEVKHGAAVLRSALHGVCARGGSEVVLGPRAAVAASGARGVYAYHNASLTLALPGVAVTATAEPRASAVQVEALRDCDRACLVLRWGEGGEGAEAEADADATYANENAAGGTESGGGGGGGGGSGGGGVASTTTTTVAPTAMSAALLDLSGNCGHGLSVAGNVDCVVVAEGFPGPAATLANDDGLLEQIIDTRLSATEQLNAGAGGGEGESTTGGGGYDAEQHGGYGVEATRGREQQLPGDVASSDSSSSSTAAVTTMAAAQREWLEAHPPDSTS